ncbi:BZ3500_MvSof-1268-A1-R1_Chr1-1g01224 [Microbotryum saponariae]|uniref:BZ3500_MvSof-1268-A1-R1_Chr1-1g01224 protein n=1 Tax=Microbotryum saponariae TaxID=289078 RepID=A0A2X0KQD0_9BASI|nr:BZ3500_MvSof-1268-A1-R1_Chr1-1g01224 [Microbotryum saponariae]SCZ93716.1 BZ3501_MvSof-1269-A2-R1_Chr1-1g00820 [Microbotryum saponariae]
MLSGRFSRMRHAVMSSPSCALSRVPTTSLDFVSETVNDVELAEVMTDHARPAPETRASTISTKGSEHREHPSTGSGAARASRNWHMARRCVAFAMVFMVGIHISATGLIISLMQTHYNLSYSQISTVYPPMIAAHAIACGGSSYLLNGIGMRWALTFVGINNDPENDQQKKKKGWTRSRTWTLPCWNQQMIPKMVNKRRRTAGPGVEPGSLPLIGKALTSKLSGP